MIPVDPLTEVARSKAVAERYYHEFVDLREVRIDHDLFHSVPVDLMFRYNFVPIQAYNGAGGGENSTLEIAIADPRFQQELEDFAMRAHYLEHKTAVYA